MIAAEMQWPAAFALSVFLVCCAAIVIYFLHLLAHTEPVDRPISTPPEWRSETVTRGANPAPEPRTKDKPPAPPPDPKEAN